MGYIYSITNLINNKVYIGQTIRHDIYSRWKQHTKMHKKSLGTCLFNAYVKYGIQNFKFKLICICFDSDANKFEIEYIKKYNTIYPNGYNLQEGGNNRKHNQFTIELIRDKLTGDKSKNYGTKLSSYTKNKISKSLTGEKNPNYNKAMSLEQKNKIKNTMNNFSLEKRKKINHLISISLKNNNHNNNAPTEKNNKLSKQVGQYNLNGEILNKYNSISHASKELIINRMSISRCCDDKYINYKTAGGFVWKYM